MATKKKQKKPAKKRRFRRHAGLLCWLGGLLTAAALLYFIIELIRLDVLPMYMLLLVMLITLIVTFLVLRFWLIRSRRPVSRLFAGILAVCLLCVYVMGGRFVSETNQMLSAVTNLTEKVANTVTVYAMINNVEKPGELNGATMGVMSADEPQGTSGLLDQLSKQNVHPQTVEYTSVYEMVDDLYAGKVDTIALPEQFHDSLNEAANDENRYNALTTFTNVVDQYIYYTDRDESTINRSNPVNNTATDPFIVLISGNDSYGTLNTVSRSDVNMLAVVNPKTAQVLIVSIPRDTYTAITCKKNPNACASVSGQFDKLTHSGIYGIAATESTVEDLLDIPINYTVRLNFSSLINIVDAMGGVDVEVEPGLEVETFYANGTEGVQAGINHLNGERALAFSRERHAYIDGDNQRVRNQQILIKAIISRMMSPTMVTSYPQVMKALSTAFETNMSTREIKQLLTLELTRFPNWNIQSVALSNNSSMEYSPSVGDYTSVTVADAGQIAYVHDLIEEVLAGNPVTAEEAINYSSGYPYYTDVDMGTSGYDYSYSGQDTADDSGWSGYGQSQEIDDYMPAPDPVYDAWDVEQPESGSSWAPDTSDDPNAGSYQDPDYTVTDPSAADSGQYWQEPYDSAAGY